MMVELPWLKPNAPRQILLGIPNEFRYAGSYAYMLDQCGLTANKIAEAVVGAKMI